MHSDSQPRIIDKKPAQSNMLIQRQKRMGMSLSLKTPMFVTHTPTTGPMVCSSHYGNTTFLESRISTGLYNTNSSAPSVVTEAC